MFFQVFLGMGISEAFRVKLVEKQWQIIVANKVIYRLLISVSAQKIFGTSISVSA